mmetsp:Transcript_33532/g.71266  ORF Transcript_33532/g.71266 Transcript_33532/m.71266 type:complete len:696 (+) Transcript_33532:66-2153(+)
MRQSLFLVAILALAAASPSGKITLAPHPWPNWVKLQQGGGSHGYGTLSSGGNGTQIEVAEEEEHETAHDEAHEKHEEAHAAEHGHGHGHGHAKAQHTLEAAEGTLKEAKEEAAEEAYEAATAKGEAVVAEATNELSEADHLQAKAEGTVAEASGDKAAAKEAAAEVKAAATEAQKTKKESKEALSDFKEEKEERLKAQQELREARIELKQAREELANDPGHGHGHGHGEAHLSHGDSHGHDSHGHDAHGHGHGHGGAGAHSVAVGLVFTVVMLPLVTWMALSEGVVHELTMKMLDTFISIFLAVLWFNCFAQFLETFNVKDAFPGAAELASVTQVTLLYVLALVIAWLWRNKTMALTTFCGCGAHYIAFAGISATGANQWAMADYIHDDHVVPLAAQPAVSFLFCILVVIVFGAASFLTWYLWRRKVEHHMLNHAVEELELDVIGLVMSFLITQAVRHAITGRYPPIGHLFLQRDFELSPGHFVHQAWQRWFMLAWAIALTVFAGVCLPKLNTIVSASIGKWAQRGIHVLKVTIIMMVAWGYLLWGQWEFYENLFHGDVMFGHMVFACIATFICLAVLYLLAWLGSKTTQTKEMRETNAITVTGVSLVAAWSWEHCFNIAFDVIGQEYQVGYKGLVPKLFLAIVIPAVLLPTYVVHVRRRVHSLEEAHGHGHGDGHGDHGHGDHDEETQTHGEHH